MPTVSLDMLLIVSLPILDIKPIKTPLDASLKQKTPLDASLKQK